jgi:hypothetical protein
MTDTRKGVIAPIQADTLEAKSALCCIRRESLATQDIPADLKQVVDKALLKLQIL